MQNQPKVREPQWTILKLLTWTTSYLKSHNIDNPRSTAEILLSNTLKLERIDLYLRYDQPLCRNELEIYKRLIKRRVSREPVAYIVGVKEFWSLDFAVTRDVLIPRPETECLVEAALSILEGPGQGEKCVLDIGTGSGAIILAIASQMSNQISNQISNRMSKPLFFASDHSIKAVELARKNAKQHDLDGRVHFFSGKWFNPLKKNIHLFDMIITNPPYIPTGDIQGLQPEIYKYEPVTALNGGKDGLDSIRHIISSAHGYLKHQGYLLVEIGYDQKKEVRRIIDGCGKYEQVFFVKDYSGHDRVVQMKKKNN